MKQNKAQKSFKTRIALIRTLVRVQNWAEHYSDGRGNYPPIRHLIGEVAFSLHLKLVHPLQDGLDEDQLAELDNVIYQWSN